MIIWTIKLLSNVRKAIAGRNHPHQLAWAVAFGLVLGLVPHGNLVALAWLFVVLSLNINHSMMAITAIGSSFIAGRLDPYSHQVGEYFLSQPSFHDTLVTAWQWPLVAWTDLNNTIVLGSFTIALAAMFPVFAVTYPVFRYLGRNARKAESEAVADQDSATAVPVASDPAKPETAKPEPAPSETHPIVVVDKAHARVSRPHLAAKKVTTEKAASLTAADFTPIADDAALLDESKPATSLQEPHIAVETRIDVIRIADYRESAKDESSDSTTMDNSEPMDEAFRYLLHQLRDTQQRKAA